MPASPRSFQDPLPVSGASFQDSLPVSDASSHPALARPGPSPSSWPTPPATVADHDRDALLAFPLHLSTAYSYARLAPNSLALRIHALKRSLNIYNRRLQPPRAPARDFYLHHHSSDTLAPAREFYLHHNSSDTLAPAREFYLHHNSSDTLALAPHHDRTHSSCPPVPRLRRAGSSPAAATMSSLNPSMSNLNLAMTSFHSSMGNPNLAMTNLNPPMTNPNPSMTSLNLAMTNSNSSMGIPNPSMTSLNPSSSNLNPSMSNPNPSMGNPNPSMSNLNPPMTNPNLAMTNPNPSMTSLNPSPRSVSLLTPSTPLENIPSPGHDLVVDAELRDMVDFLAHDTSLAPRIADVALMLEQFALGGDPGLSSLHEYAALRKRLLYTLASPYFEHSHAPDAPSPTWTFHPPTAVKHATPQSVFTVDLNSPWRVKAANDLACLMFGVSKSTIPHLALMDLIAPQFRQFVSCRLMRLMQLVLELPIRARPPRPRPAKIRHPDLVFAGEIVAILRPGDQNYAWTSVWAKRKGNLIIFMFDQIQCDAFNVGISYLRPLSDIDIAVTSTSAVAGNLFHPYRTRHFANLAALCPALALDIAAIDDHHHDEDHHDENHHDRRDARDVAMINSTRYYTFRFPHLPDHVPCAVACDLLESSHAHTEIKLKVHAMPHISGAFVVDSLLHRVLACNKAVAKNLFGRGTDDMARAPLDSIVPRFSAILATGLAHNPQIVLAPGLILPEHFFRRYDAVLRAGDKDGVGAGATAEAAAEALFFASRGIAGLHRDGNTVLVDVQLRVSLPTTFVVWITYSRPAPPEKDLAPSHHHDPAHDRGRAPAGLDRPQHSPPPFTDDSPPPPPPKPHRLPSQLDLLPGLSRDETFDYACPTQIERHSSTRKARADTLGLPVRYLQSKKSSAVPAGAAVTAATGLEHRQAQARLPVPAQTRVSTLAQAETPAQTPASVPAQTPPTATAKPQPLAQPLASPDHDQARDRSSAIATPTLLISNSSSSQPELASSTAPASPLRIVTPTTYSEEQMVQMEDAELQARIAQSTHWPTQVGQMRRTKKFSAFIVLKDMGQGAYGKVVMAQHKDDPHYTVIIKCIDKERILVDTWVRDRQLGTIPLEIQIMAFLNGKRHPNIMSIVDYFEDAKYYYLETPIFGNPHAIDLFDYIEIQKNMLEQDCRYIFKQIASTVYHLHQNGIVHRDIKDENVIVDEHGMVKLIDFGLASYVRQGPFDVFVGTIDYALPEVLGGQKYDGKPQDVWALGILLYTILYKENPFYNVDEIMEGELRFPYPISEGAQLLMSRILVRDIQHRLTVTDIVEDKWLQLE